MRRLLGLAAVLVGCLLSVGGSAQQNGAFDHFTTGFRLDGAHRTVDCESCHVAGVFQGTPFECVGCHTEGGRVRASARPAQHPLTTNFCVALNTCPVGPSPGMLTVSGTFASGPTAPSPL